MAATIAKAKGSTRGKDSTWATRLGGDHAIGQANTWHTFTECVVWADGHGHVEVKRDGKTIHFYEFPAEAEGPLVLGSTRKSPRR